MKIMRPTLMSLVLCMGLPGVTYGIGIPIQTDQLDIDSIWKKDLYNWLEFNLNSDPNAIVNEGNFSVPLSTTGFPPPFRQTDDLRTNPGTCTPSEVKHLTEQGWLMEGGTGPIMDSLLLPNSVFTLDYFEGIQHTPPHAVNTSDYVVQPINYQTTIGMGFLYQFNYGQCTTPVGNPYYHHPGILNRAITLLATELIMLDQMHKTLGNASNQNYARASITNSPSTYSTMTVDPSCYMSTSMGNQPPQLNENPLPSGSPNFALCGAQVGTLFYNSPYYLALNLEDLAYEYYFIRDALPLDLVLHFDTAFLRLGDRLAAWGPATLHVNRTLPGANALFLIQHMTQDSNALQNYLTYTSILLDPSGQLYEATGYFADDYGWDVSYNRINLTHLGRLARLESQLGPTSLHTQILDTLDEMYFLKAHMTVADPDGYRGYEYSPTHTSARTYGDVVTGQGQRVASAFDALSLGILDAYSEFGGWDPANYPVLSGVPSGPGAASYANGGNQGDQNTSIGSTINQNSAYYVQASTPYIGVRPWQTDETPDYYRPALTVALHDPAANYFADWKSAIVLDPSLSERPMERSSPGYEIINNEYLWYKNGDMTTLIHVGPVSGYEDYPAALPEVSNLPGGYGGGMLSYLSGSSLGGGILSWRRNRYQVGNQLAESMDNWNLWDRWPLHAVWLSVPDGNGGLKHTSSARILNPAHAFGTLGAGSPPPQAIVDVGGVIPTSNARYGQVLSSPQSHIDYQRVFNLDAKKIEVNTTLWAQTPELVSSVVETIPLHGVNFIDQGYYAMLAGDPWEDITITLYDNGVGPVDGLQNPDVWYDTVTEVVYERLSGTMVVRFDRPRRIKLTGEYNLWYHYTPGAADGQLAPGQTHPAHALSMSKRKNRNIVIDLLDNVDGHPTQYFNYSTITYHIFTY